MKQKKIDIPIPKKPTQDHLRELPAVELRDRILGALVGSAIGDAMGASTEMWTRDEIQRIHGYITGLTPATRDKSAEGTWQHNMSPGATTDDTRWKFLIGQYFQSQDNLSDVNFASFIADYYKQLVREVGDAAESTDQVDDKIEQVQWMKEWARVGMAYGSNPADFAKAQNRFYGGEMSCAGMLYSPMFAFVSGSAEEAYLIAYEHSIFDIGYARDISALVSVLTFNAMYYEDMDSLLEQSSLVDPHSYMDSRLLGRISRSMLQEARSMASSQRIIEKEETLLSVPEGFPGSSVDWHVQQEVYKRLALKQKAIAFHASEIWQILIAALEFGGGDFLKTIQFIVNYGRDNDTVAAVAGMILGAKVGYSALPSEIRDEVVRVSREVMGMDLHLLAEVVVESAH